MAENWTFLSDASISRCHLSHFVVVVVAAAIVMQQLRPIGS